MVAYKIYAKGARPMTDESRENEVEGEEEPKASEEATDAEKEGQEATPKATISANEFLDEMSGLGQKLGQAFQDVLDKDQRRVMRAKVVDELKTAGDQVQSLAGELKTGTVGGKDIQSVVVDELRQAKGQVETLAKEVSSSMAAQEISEKTENIGRKLGEGLLSGLRALNRELGKALEPEQDRQAREQASEEDEETR